MKLSPQHAGKIHFVGIGGIGMSGIAEILHSKGYHVTGSDIAENGNIDRLRAQNIRVSVPHNAGHVHDASVVVVSTAVKADNPEVMEAANLSIPVVHRSEMLAELMRPHFAVSIAGTHGKTTTTSIGATMLDHAGFDPIVVNGGIINAYGTNARLGQGDWFVAEADESDGSFLRLPRTIAVVTNIDPEHIDHYGDFEAVKRAFYEFVVGIPYYGLGVLCYDHVNVRELAEQLKHKRIVTYGFDERSDLQAVNLRVSPKGTHFDIKISDNFRRVCHKAPHFDHFEDLFLSMVGQHNVQNCLSVIAIAFEMGINISTIKEALANFQGVSRRFTEVGCFEEIKIIDDYAHHPEEIKAVLKTARDICEKKVVAVFQPHRYSRFSDLFEEFCQCFSDADIVIAAPVYAAGEKPIEHLTQDYFKSALAQYFNGQIIGLANPEELASLVYKTAEAGDYVVCLGAGNISQWSRKLQSELNAVRDTYKNKLVMVGS
ncbi:MAG: UDP-N-acetylmuramate--L-alanine ligase [Caedimonadaceae bacterium]|nr:MAG: UDP-N-acetylmuramate--L-alanine ligase [Caedimonadaceae bacterium]